MKVLFIGGSGIISTASTKLAIERGIELYLLNRGNRAVPAGAISLQADINDVEAVQSALGDLQFDSVVNWVNFTPDQIERDIALFSGRTKQYIFISSASAYQKPVGHYLISESTPLANPLWDYSRNKIACEERLMQEYRTNGFPFTVVRPSLTYGDTQIPLVTNSWQKPYTIIQRMRQGKPVVVPGDGTSLWTITHNSDFAKGLVGLLGHTQAIGHAFHITSDESLTWDQFYQIVGDAIGVQPKIVHIASDFISACMPDMLGSLQGDKVVSVVFDNSKIKRFVPDFCATTTFAQGIRQTIANFDADPSLQAIDEELDAAWDRLLEAYEAGLAAARQRFNQ